MLFSTSRHWKLYPYTLSPHVLSIRFDLVHLSIKCPLESQFLDICVDKLYIHFNVCRFRLFLTVYSILTDIYECKWRSGDDIYVNRLNRCVYSCVPFSLFNWNIFIILYNFKWQVLLWPLVHIDYIYCGLFHVAVWVF